MHNLAVCGSIAGAVYTRCAVTSQVQLAVIITLRNASSSRSRKTSGRSGKNRSLATPATTLAMTAFRSVMIKAVQLVRPGGVLRGPLPWFAVEPESKVASYQRSQPLYLVSIPFGQLVSE